MIGNDEYVHRIFHSFYVYQISSLLIVLFNGHLDVTRWISRKILYNIKSCYFIWMIALNICRYVQIGNGNQLIRDPKRRTRKLANEKVRWSLHTARQRLARKQKYCQFFTRFGKCNKDGGKCPYIHDPSKIAVCTKFLNGLCSTPNCKLTHKVFYIWGPTNWIWSNAFTDLSKVWVSLIFLCRLFQRECQIVLTSCKVRLIDSSLSSSE